MSNSSGWTTVTARDRNVLLQYAGRWYRPDEAEDVVQEALIRTWQRQDATRGFVMKYAIKCVNSIIIDRLRKHRPPEQLSDLYVGAAGPSADGVWYDQLYAAVAQRNLTLAELMDHRVLGGMNSGHSAMYSRRMVKLRTLLAELGVKPNSSRFSAQGSQQL